MPKSRPITAPLREALLECFRATTRLVRPQHRRQLILVGAASVVHSSVLHTEDMDVVAPAIVLTELWQAARAGAPSFVVEPDDKIAFDALQDIRLHVDLIEIGNRYIERTNVTEPFEGSVASMSDLLSLRAVTVVERGSDGEAADFRWLLSKVAGAGQILPGLDDDELEYLNRAGESILGLWDRLALASVFPADNVAAAMRLINSKCI